MADPSALLDSATTIAVVGISTDPGKPAHHVPAQLQEAGFRILPVNPSADNLLGERAYASLEDVSEPVDIVEVFRPAAEAPGIAKQAVSIGAKGLWLQKGISSDEARGIAEHAGLSYVEDVCMGTVQRSAGITRG